MAPRLVVTTKLKSRCLWEARSHQKGNKKLSNANTQMLQHQKTVADDPKQFPEIPNHSRLTRIGLWKSVCGLIPTAVGGQAHRQRRADGTRGRLLV